MANEWMRDVGAEDSGSFVRIGSAIAGGILMTMGSRLQLPARIGAMLGGGVLLYWGATGDPRLCRAIGIGSSCTKSGVASVHHNRAIRIEKAVTVAGPLEELYRIWRNPENIPCFADRVKSVRAITGRRSHWIAAGPAGKSIEWESEIYNEKQNESFAWRSMLNADLNHAGSVHFRSVPGSSETEVRVVMSYEPLGGALGSWVAKMSTSDPEKQVCDGLHRFKQAYEAGLLHQ